jgi:hypothetical protein
LRIYLENLTAPQLRKIIMSWIRALIWYVTTPGTGHEFAAESIQRAIDTGIELYKEKA